MLVVRHGYTVMSGLSHDLSVSQVDILCLQTLSFYFPPCGKIPPPVIMVQNVSFRYTKDGVSMGLCIQRSLVFLPCLGVGDFWLSFLRGQQCMTREAKFLPVLMLCLLGIEHYRCSREILGSTEKA